jgi:hypothetical protein
MLEFWWDYMFGFCWDYIVAHRILLGFSFLIGMIMAQWLIIRDLRKINREWRSIVKTYESLQMPFKLKGSNKNATLKQYIDAVINEYNEFKKNQEQ